MLSEAVELNPARAIGKSAALHTAIVENIDRDMF